MKEITYIQFGSGWIPPTHRRLNIMNRIFIKTGISEKGAEYMIMRGHITDEDATLLKLLDQHAKIRDVKEEKMSAGILRNWYIAKIAKATNPIEYFLAVQAYTLYELSIISFNTKSIFKPVFDK